MNKQLVHIIETGYYTIGVSYDSSDVLYTFKVSNNIVLQEGDLVLVSDRNNKFFRTVVVKRIDVIENIAYDSDIEYKWVVSKVDTSEYDRIMELEAKLKLELEYQFYIARQEAKRTELISKSNLTECMLDYLMQQGKIDNGS